MRYLDGLTLLPNIIIEVICIDRPVDMARDYCAITHLNLNAFIQSSNNFTGSSLWKTCAVDVFLPNFCNKYSDSSATPPVPVKHPITFPSS
jgi:hypothetical protein